MEQGLKLEPQRTQSSIPSFHVDGLCPRWVQLGRERLGLSQGLSVLSPRAQERQGEEHGEKGLGMPTGWGKEASQDHT